MKTNIRRNLLMLFGVILYFGSMLGLFPSSDGELHSLYSFTRPQIFNNDFHMLWTWIVAFTFMTCIMLLMHKPTRIFGELGLSDNRLFQSIAIGPLFTLPMFVVNAIFGQFAFSWKTIGISLMAGICEEIFFRGYLFGQLFRNCHWGFLSATLITSMFFGFMHLYQGHDIISTLLAILVTSAGGILYSWMYVEWNYRLWIPISLHTFMDAAWMLFPVGEEGYGAAGNVITNVGRCITIALAIGATFHFKHKRGEKCFDFKKI